VIFYCTVSTGTIAGTAFGILPMARRGRLLIALLRKNFLYPSRAFYDVHSATHVVGFGAVFLLHLLHELPVYKRQVTPPNHRPPTSTPTAFNAFKQDTQPPMPILNASVVISSCLFYRCAAISRHRIWLHRSSPLQLDIPGVSTEPARARGAAARAIMLRAWACHLQMALPR